jgi:hypothetical protein
MASAITSASLTLNDQPLSILVLAAKILIEDMAALSPGATQQWLYAVLQEGGAKDAVECASAQSARARAFGELVRAHHSLKSRADGIDARFVL